MPQVSMFSSVGEYVCHFNISLIVRGNVPETVSITTTFEQRGRPKRNRIEVHLLTSLMLTTRPKQLKTAWLPVFGICNVRTIVDACDCTWGQYEPRKRGATFLLGDCSLSVTPRACPCVCMRGCVCVCVC